MSVLAAKSILGVGADLLGYSDRGLLILAEAWDLMVLAVGFGHPPWLHVDSDGLDGPGRRADRDRNESLAQDGLVRDDPGHGDV